MPRADGRRRVKLANDNVKDVGFYNPHDGLKGRDGGPYLDALHRQEAEVRRAAAEGREPSDLNGVLPADAGTPLVIAGLVQDNSAYSNPSMAGRGGFESLLTDDNLAAKSYSDDTNEVGFADPVSVLPVDSGEVADDANVVDQTVDGNPSVAGVEAEAAKGNSISASAKPNGKDDDSKPTVASKK